LRYEFVRDAQDERFRKLIAIGTAVAAAVGLLVPLTHLGATIVIPLMIVAHLVVIRLYLIREARRYLGPSRRFFSRWMTRLSFLWLGGPGYGMAVIPLGGAVISGGVFAGLSWLAHNYVLASLARERDHKPAATWEVVTLAVLAVLTTLVVVVVLGLVLVLGWSLSHAFDWLGG
jgi:hypothetical protein